MEQPFKQNDLIGGQVLIVDDESVNQMILQEILEKGGISPIIAKSGEEALDLVKQLPPDLVLLDIVLGRGIDGFEVCRRLRSMAEFEKIPILFISALTEEKDRHRGFEAGGTDYITKPFNPDEVLSRVRVHIKQDRLQRALSKTVKAFTHQSPHSKLREQALRQLKQDDDSLLDSKHLLESEYQELATLIETLKVQKIELQLHNEQLQNSEKLHQQEIKSCRKLFEQSPVATLLIDGEGQITQMNRAARLLTDIEQLPPKGSPLIDHITDPSIWSEIKSQRKKPNTSFWKQRIEFKSIHDTLHPVEATATYDKPDEETILTLVPQQ